MITRDSLVLILGILASFLGYLVTAQTPFWQWTYMQWLQGLMFLVGVVLAWLRSSPLAGGATPIADSVTALGGLVKVYDKKD